MKGGINRFAGCIYSGSVSCKDMQSTLHSVAKAKVMPANDHLLQIRVCVKHSGSVLNHNKDHCYFEAARGRRGAMQRRIWNKNGGYLAGLSGVLSAGAMCRDV